MQNNEGSAIEKIKVLEKQVESRFREIAALTLKCEQLEDVNLKNSKQLTTFTEQNNRLRRENKVLLEKCLKLESQESKTSEKLDKAVHLYKKTAIEIKATQKLNDMIGFINGILINQFNCKTNRLSLIEKLKLQYVKSRASKQEFKEYQKIFHSGLFDNSYYLRNNEDVKKSTLFRHFPLLHYVKFGFKEGREPCFFFSSVDYKKHHDELNTDKINPLLHFIDNALSS